VEIAMPRLTLTGRLPTVNDAPLPEGRADFLDLFQAATQGLLPLPMLEAMLSRMEGSR
jgi:hypothetical protein